MVIDIAQTLTHERGREVVAPSLELLATAFDIVRMVAIGCKQMCVTVEQLIRHGQQQVYAWNEVTSAYLDMKDPKTVSLSLFG